jgi:hypothetical protein
VFVCPKSARLSANQFTSERREFGIAGGPRNTGLQLPEKRCGLARIILLDRRTAGHQQRSTGTALILARHRVVEEAFRETNVRLVSMHAIGQRQIASAFREGWRAGDRVNLGRPVTGDALGLIG